MGGWGLETRPKSSKNTIRNIDEWTDAFTTRVLPLTKVTVLRKGHKSISMSVQLATRHCMVRQTTHTPGRDLQMDPTKAMHHNQIQFFVAGDIPGDVISSGEAATTDNKQSQNTASQLTS